MSYRNRIIGLLAALIIGLTACGGGSDNPPNTNNNGSTPQDQTNAVPALPLDENGQQLVAKVNGEAITLVEFERAFRRQQLQASAASYDALANDVLSTLIEQRLINQAAVEMGVSVTDADIEAEYQNMRQLRQSDAEWQAWLDENIYTEVELRASLRDSMLTQRAQEQVVQLDAASVTEVNARHIVVATEAEATGIMARLDAGEDFAALAAAYSTDVTSREDGGNLGWFTMEDLLTPELAETAFDMQINEVRGPIQTMLGYHIIQLLDTRQRNAQPEESFALANQQFNVWLSNLLNQATIERYISS